MRSGNLFSFCGFLCIMDPVCMYIVFLPLFFSPCNFFIPD